MTKLQRTVLVAIRNPVSQETMNRKLGFQTNQVHRWETGRTKIPWGEFTRVCQVRNMPLDQALKMVTGYGGTVDDAQGLVEFFAGHLSNAKLARRLSVSKSTVERWRQGKAAPTFEQMMRLMSEASKWSVSSFLQKLLGPDKMIPMPNQDAQKAKETLIEELPWSPCIISYLDTSEYRSHLKHPDGFFAKKLKIPLTLEKFALDEMVAAGVIEFKEGTYFNVRGLKNSSTSGSPRADKLLRQYWAKRFCAHMELQTAGGFYWPLTFISVDEPTLEKIKALMTRCFHEVAELALAAPGETLAAIVSFQCTDVAKLAAPSGKS